MRQTRFKGVLFRGRLCGEVQRRRRRGLGRTVTPTNFSTTREKRASTFSERLAPKFEAIVHPDAAPEEGTAPRVPLFARKILKTAMVCSCTAS